MLFSKCQSKERDNFIKFQKHLPQIQKFLYTKLNYLGKPQMILSL